MGAMESFSLLVQLEKSLGRPQCLASSETDITSYRLGPLIPAGRPGVGGVEEWAEGSAASEGNVVRIWAPWAEQHGATAAGTQLIRLRAKLRP